MQWRPRDRRGRPIAAIGPIVRLAARIGPPTDEHS
jgi:hypothetical protein